MNKTIVPKAAVITVCVLVPAIVGCIPASFQPGNGVNHDYALVYGCDYEVLMADAARLKASLPSGKHYVPQVGWTACELLAHVGAPYKIDRQETQYSSSRSWWYKENGTYGDMHLVTLVWSDKRRAWVVDYVGW